MIHDKVIIEARKQIGLLLRKLRTERNIGTKKMSSIIGITEARLLDIELNRTNYTIDSFLRYVHGLDMYFFLSEKEGNHLNIEHMISKADPDKAAL